MSLTERQQMSLDTESAAHIRMECQSKSSQKYLLLQVWCGFLTVAVVIMAALFASAKTKSAEDLFKGEVSALQQDSVSQTGCRPSYIQLRRHDNSWKHLDSMKCESCSLILYNNSIQSRTQSLYFIYAHVSFSRNEAQPKSVILKRNASYGKTEKKLVEGILPRSHPVSPGTPPPTHITYGTLWVGKIVKLSVNESLSLDITGEYHTDNTFWGAYQLR